MKVQNLFVSLTASLCTASIVPSWSLAATTPSSQSVYRPAAPTLVAQVTYATNRTNRTCPSRVSPKQGAISLTQAKTYFICRYESFLGPLNKIDSQYTFVDDLNMQMAAARRPMPADRGLGYEEDIDLKQPVYPIKVSYRRTSCPAYNPSSPSEAGRGKCMVTDEVKGVGACFRSTFGEWHCKTRPTGSTAMRWAVPSWAN